jgi:hypothetical protein
MKTRGNVYVYVHLVLMLLLDFLGTLCLYLHTKLQKNVPSFYAILAKLRLARFTLILAKIWEAWKV